MLNPFVEEFVVVKQFESNYNDRVIEVGEIWQNTGYSMTDFVGTLVLKLMREVDGKREWLYVSLWKLEESFEEYNKNT